MADRPYRLRHQSLQSLAVFVVSFCLITAAWYLLWPYGHRSVIALAAGLALSVFCAAASWMRSHDDEWEASHLRTRPILSLKRIREEAGARRASAESPKADKQSRKAERAKRKAEAKKPSVPGFEELANLRGTEADLAIAIPAEPEGETQPAE